MSQFFMQATAGQIQSSASACTAVFDSAVAAGGFIFVAVHSYDASITVAVSDDLGNTYSQIGSYLNQSGAGTRLSIWYAPNITGGSCTVSATPSGSGFLGVVALEYSGVATVSPLDGTASAAGSGDGATGSITVSGSDELVIAAFSDFAGAASPGNVWRAGPSLDLDFASVSLNTGIGGHLLVCSGVTSSNLNATLKSRAGAYIGAAGASFTGSFGGGGGGGSTAIVVDED